MYWQSWQFVGMHFFWWMFWAALFISFFAWAVPVPRKRVYMYREEDPLGILQRRYAAGEINTEEYEQRKARLLRDINDPSLRPYMRFRHDQNAPA